MRKLQTIWADYQNCERQHMELVNQGIDASFVGKRRDSFLSEYRSANMASQMAQGNPRPTNQR